jgi:thiol-disulfide isomerase/thioredoxin
LSSIQNFFKKQYKKFRQKKWYSKAGDIFTVLLIVLIFIPSTRKELRTYASKVKMHLTSVEKEKTQINPGAKNSLILKDPSGKQTNLGTHLNKPVFINFWATWCPPCRAEMPSIQKLYEKYKNEVNFLIISDQSLEKQQGFLKQNNYELPVYQLLSRPKGSFSYNVLPTTMIISSDEKIILKKEGAHNWNSKTIRKIINDLKD